MYLASVEETLLSSNEQKSLSGSHFLGKKFQLYNRSRLPLVCGTNSKKIQKSCCAKPRKGKKGLDKTLREKGSAPGFRGWKVRCNISNTSNSVSSGYPNTEKIVLVLTKFEVFG